MPTVSMLLVIPVVLAAGFFWLNRPLLVPNHGSLSADFPVDRFSHDEFEHLLTQFVDGAGRVNYEAWLTSGESVTELESYLVAVSRYSPDSAPDRFATRSDELIYWIHGYNAYVIRSVLAHWPINSVTDIKAPIEAVTGLGFFHRLRYQFGGKYYSLRSVENNRIRKQYRDARVHFVLNCAAESCPILQPVLPAGPELEVLLSSAATEFVNDMRNVSIDHANKKIVLSTIFKWYRKDFLNDLRMRGVETRRGLIDYVASIAPDGLRSELDKTDGYEVVFQEYDWAINSSDL